MTAVAIRQHLRTNSSRFVLKRGAKRVRLDDTAFHCDALEREPEVYALESLGPNVQAGQRARAIYHLLRRSRAAFSPETNEMLDRVTDLLLVSTAADDVLTVFLALRRERVNRKSVSRVILRYVLNHPCVEDLAARRRPAVVDCIEHALGRNVARACAKALQSDEQKDRVYAERHLLRHARDPQRVGAVVRTLYQKAENRQLAQSRPYDSYPHTSASVQGTEEKVPKTVTATNRGDIAATLVHLYRGGNNTQLLKAVDEYVERRAAGMPKFDGAVSLVLDLSQSTRGYGAREFCCVSQSLAFRLVLEQCCHQLHVHPVGGSGNPPWPSGDTDLAIAVIDALQDEPDLVVIVSDGYENVEGGDLARVLATLDRLDIKTPVVFCHSMFSGKDALDLRRPAQSLPELHFWHENDFETVLESLFATALGDASASFLRKRLGEKITQREQEVSVWTRIN